MAWQKPTPRPGHPIARRKPYVWATWLAKLLGGDRCLYSGWFKAHYQHAKYEVEKDSLVEWNRQHTALMRERRAALERAGWAVSTEDANAFTLEGKSADVAGQPDLLALLDDQALIVDGKTGRERDSDIWQVRLYLYALAEREDLAGKDLVGEVFYSGGRDAEIVAAPSQVHVDEIVRVIKLVSATEAPAKVPSWRECKRCNIGRADCPQRHPRADSDEDIAAAAEAAESPF